MKLRIRRLISFLIIIASYFYTSTAQTSLNGFLNIPFGTKIETAKKLLLQKTGVKFISQRNRNSFSFTGLSLGAYDVDTCFLIESQSDGKFESSNLAFYSKAELLEEIYELNCAKYGNPITKYSKENDVIYRWEFPVKGSKYKNSITLQSVSAANYFMLSYSGMGTLSPGWLTAFSKNKK